MAAATVRIETEDATFQQLEALRHSRKQRNRQGSFLVEGVRALEQLQAHSWNVRALVYSTDGALSGWASQMVASSTAPAHYLLPAHLLAKLSAKNEPSELLAVVTIPEDDLERLELDALPLIVVVDRSTSHGNLGTIIRSSDALGAHGVVVTGHSVDLYDPQTVAATVGSLFAVPVIRAPAPGDLAPLFNRMREIHGDLQVVATSAHADRSLFEVNFWRPTVLLLGNERDGLSAAYRDIADTMVSIPMFGSASSLNVASAASILLYEVQRQRSR